MGEIGPIPYAKNFGCNENIQTTLKQFLEAEIKSLAPSGFPYYVFSVVDDQLQPLLSQMIRTDLNDLPERLPPPFQQFRAFALQFSVGGNGSGSPVHFHNDAFNILLSGKKKWWLWPPARAALSRVHPTCIPDAFDAEELHGAIEVLQNPGDIVYVPMNWGHAVLNLDEYTICVAVEFGI